MFEDESEEQELTVDKEEEKPSTDAEVLKPKPS